MTQQSERELCRECHGNGVVKIRHGVSVCDHCKGDCYEPSPPESLRVMHARKQGEADGFQQGWHAALHRIREGNRLHDLSELVPRFPSPRGLTAPPAAMRLRIEVFQEDDGQFAACWETADGKEAGMGEYAATPVGALADLCAALIKVDEDKARERAAGDVPPTGSASRVEVAREHYRIMRDVLKADPKVLAICEKVLREIEAEDTAD